MDEAKTLEEIKNFIGNNKMALLLFSTENCSVCVDLKPKIEELSIKYPNLKVIKIDMNKLTEASGEYSVFTIPTVDLYIEGKETIRKGRFVSVQQLDILISRYYNILFS